jgi:hypothetical protein
MKDEQLERIALIATISGLLLILLLMPKYEAVDAHYLTEDENKAYLKGTITRKTYNNESGWSYAEIETCRNTKSFYEGEIEKETGEEIHIQGSYHDNKFSIKTYK